MDQCIFCKITEGIIPSARIYEDDYFRAILDISPAAKGHVIILPKKHAKDLFDLDEETAKRVVPIAQKIGAAIMEELSCDGINMLQNNGTAAGQTIFHYHVHLIPRYDGDQVKLSWNHGEYQDGEAARLAEAIAGRMQ